MYEGGIRVPFIVRGPKIAPGSVCSTPVTGLDLFPTIAELAGYQQSLPEVLDDGSITGVLFNEGQGDVERHMPFLIFHQAVARRPESALILGDYRLVKDWKDDKVELFDLSEEQIEQRDISMLEPDKTAELHAKLSGFLAEVGAETRNTGTNNQVYKRATSGFKQP
ncbi:MAG: sulfatase/phosphatase domain-containing protein [Planctomycetota bacterium]